MSSVLLFVGIGKSMGQQCTGYVLYKEDFGSGSSEFGNPLPAAVTSYDYTTNIPVEDGYYGIRKEVQGHKESWFQAKDHTGNGYMMLINASYTPGLFYETKIDNLCQGSSFYFSAWVANLMMKSASGPLDPNLKFVIRRASDGAIVSTLETGPLKRYTTLTWEQCGINFSLPSGESSVILQIFNNAGGGNGNDLVLDDITFSICGPDIKMEQVGVYGDSYDICKGKEVTFNAAISDNYYSNPEYLWQFSSDDNQWQNINDATSPVLHYSAAGDNQTGWYRILVSEKGNINSEHCRIASDPVPLHVKPPVQVKIISNSPVCEGNTLNLEASEGALAYEWKGPGEYTNDQSTLSFDKASIAQDGTYTLTSTTAGGCVSEYSTHVAVTRNDLKVAFQDSLFCKGNSITLDATNEGASYTWNTGEHTPTISTVSSGFYKVTVTKEGCEAADSITVRSISMPQVNLGNDTTICMGEPYTLNVEYPDVARYLWQDGSDASTYVVSHQGLYSATLSNVCGTATDAVFVKTEDCADRLIFPTAFSPNGDGVNDYFRPRIFLRVDHYKMMLYDRWGHMVFQGESPAAGWNGQYKGNKLPVGSYIWVCSYIRERDNEPISQKGVVTLVR